MVIDWLFDGKYFSLLPLNIYCHLSGVCSWEVWDSFKMFHSKEALLTPEDTLWPQDSIKVSWYMGQLEMDCLTEDPTMLTTHVKPKWTRVGSSVWCPFNCQSLTVGGRRGKFHGKNAILSEFVCPFFSHLVVEQLLIYSLYLSAEMQKIKMCWLSSCTEASSWSVLPVYTLSMLAP